jgi:hypothetical protein
MEVRGVIYHMHVTTKKAPLRRGSLFGSGAVTYEDIKFVIRAGLGRNEWTLLVYYPDNVGGNPSIFQFSGSRDDAIASARQRIDRWIRRQRRKAQLAS